MAVHELAWHQRLAVGLLAGLMRLWTRTLRFEWGRDVDALMDSPPESAVVILWHNRLFVSPEFYRRYFKDRELVVLISASGDGAWLSAFMQRLGIRAVRGSHYKRGARALRELIQESRAKRVVGVTPDGSRGPIYEMKTGAVAVALKTGAPVVLLSFNFSRAWRLRSWDRFYLPLPFSRISVQAEQVEMDEALRGMDLRDAANELKQRLDAMTRDADQSQ